MAQVVLGEDGIDLNLKLADRILSVHGSLHIPYEHIDGARVENEHGWNHLWLKLVGTNAPGIKMAGTFWLDGGMAFLDYSSGENCLVIETQSETYKTIIVQPDAGEDAQALADAINKKVPAPKSTNESG